MLLRRFPDQHLNPISQTEPEFQAAYNLNRYRRYSAKVRGHGLGSGVGTCDATHLGQVWVVRSTAVAMVAAIVRPRPQRVSRHCLGETTCLTLLVYTGCLQMLQTMKQTMMTLDTTQSA